MILNQKQIDQLCNVAKGKVIKSLEWIPLEPLQKIQGRYWRIVFTDGTELSFRGDEHGLFYNTFPLE